MMPLLTKLSASGHRERSMPHKPYSKKGKEAMMKKKPAAKKAAAKKKGKK